MAKEYIVVNINGHRDGGVEVMNAKAAEGYELVTTYHPQMMQRPNMVNAIMVRDVEPIKAKAPAKKAPAKKATAKKATKE